jgi:hypothetical protein
VLLVYLDEIRKLKEDRDRLKFQIEQASAETGSLVSVGVLESRLRERIKSLETGIRSKDVQVARDMLAQYVEKVEVAPNKEALLVAKQGFPILTTESVHIPRRLQTLSGLTTDSVHIPTGI